MPYFSYPVMYMSMENSVVRMRVMCMLCTVGMMRVVMIIHVLVFFCSVDQYVYARALNTTFDRRLCLHHYARQSETVELFYEGCTRVFIKEFKKRGNAFDRYTSMLMDFMSGGKFMIDGQIRNFIDRFAMEASKKAEDGARAAFSLATKNRMKIDEHKSVWRASEAAMQEMRAEAELEDFMVRKQEI